MSGFGGLILIQTDILHFTLRINCVRADLENQLRGQYGVCSRMRTGVRLFARGGPQRTNLPPRGKKPPFPPQ